MNRRVLASSPSVKLDETAEFALVLCHEEDSEGESEGDTSIPSPFGDADAETLGETHTTESWDLPP